MIFDDTLYKLIIEQKDFNKDEIKLTRGYNAIKTHQNQFNTKFSIEQIKKALEGEDDSGYGLKNLKENVSDIKSLHDKLSRDYSWIDKVREILLKYFSIQCIEDIYICPVIGYDAGIGVENTVCVNLNFKPYHDNYKECIAVVIHEATHIAYSRKHSFHLKIDTKASIIEAMQYLIPYEGVAIFIAKEYREKNNLLKPVSNALRKDYLVSDNDYEELLEIYQKVLKAKTYEEGLNFAFGEHKLTHRLGYYLVNKYAKEKGIDGVKEIINMNYKEFINTFI